MTDHAPETPTADADHGIDRLCGEVALLRRAIEGLAAERQAAPDYGPTLHAIDDRMTQFAGWARRVAETPLLRMTPAKLEQEIARVAESARQADRETIQRYDASMAKAIEAVDRVTDSAWKASDQWRALLITAGVSALLAVVLTLALVRLYSGDATAPVSQATPAHVAAAPATPPQAAPPAHLTVTAMRSPEEPGSSPDDRISLTTID